MRLCNSCKTCFGYKASGYQLFFWLELWFLESTNFKNFNLHFKKIHFFSVSFRL